MKTIVKTWSSRLACLQSTFLWKMVPTPPR
jgi:hypothetical protein